jgi:hypothetical protein
MQQRNGFFEGIAPLEYYQRKKADVPNTGNTCLSNIPSVEPIPGELLPSRAHFRFGSTIQSSKHLTIFTTC